MFIKKLRFFSRFGGVCLKNFLKGCKKCSYDPKKIFLTKCNRGIKKRRIWCYLRMLKSCKKLIRKKVSAKIDIKMGFLTFITVCKSFWTWILWHFFNGFKLSIKLCSYDTLHEFLLLSALFANFKAKIGRVGSKNYKRVLQMCHRIPFYIDLRSGRLRFHKKVKLYPNVHIYVCTVVM